MLARWRGQLGQMPSLEAFTLLVRAASNAGQFDSALAFFRLLIKAQVRIASQSHVHALVELARAQFKPDAAVFDALLDACTAHNQGNRAFGIWQVRGCPAVRGLSESSFVALANLLSQILVWGAGYRLPPTPRQARSLFALLASQPSLQPVKFGQAVDLVFE